MMGLTENLIARAEREWRLPQIESSDCVYSQFRGASCRACVDACPRNAWLLDDYALGLDVDACDGCGLCVPVCPTGALHKDFPWVIRHLGGRSLALFACERSGILEQEGILPCVHMLGLRQLTVLHTSGVSSLLLATGDCDHCAWKPGTGLVQRLESFNRLLRQRNLPPMNLLVYTKKLWLKIFAQEVVIGRGTQLQRRAFFAAAASPNKLQQQLAVLDPLNLKACQTLAPGSLLPGDESHAELLWPWAPQLDIRRCEGCDACFRLCPVAALELVPDEQGLVYRIRAAQCTGCGICADVCEQQAIRPIAEANVPLSQIPLIQKRCAKCGNPYHLPQGNPALEHDLCLVCHRKQADGV